MKSPSIAAGPEIEKLTGRPEEGSGGTQAHGEARVQTVIVNDERLDFVAGVYKPKKTTWQKSQHGGVGLVAVDQRRDVVAL